MSSEGPRLTAEHVGKCFRIYRNPLERLAFGWMPGGGPRHRPFWALKDVNFDLKPGDALGVIGRNGSGKSTLLQILCGTLEPTEGRVYRRGRIAAILELGAGFSPDFTGRENIYLAGALHGLTRRQIRDRFDRIAAFADIGPHLEQPIRTYSSGMLVRLAFALIAHVDADILIVDEALAVGDAAFAQKCMRFVRSFRERGILLFVSHDRAAVLSLCPEAIWLDRGEVKAQGPCMDVSDRYLRQSVAGNAEGLAFESLVGEGERENGWKTGLVNLTRVEVETSPARAHLSGGESVRVTLEAHALVDLRGPILGFIVRDRLGQELFGQNTNRAPSIQVSSGQDFRATFDFKWPLLPDGDYAISASVAEGTQESHTQHHWLHEATQARVRNSPVKFGLVGLPFEQVKLEVCPR